MQWTVWYVSASDFVYFDHVLADRNDTAFSQQYRQYIGRLWDRVAKSLNTSRLDTIRDKLLYQAIGYPIVMYDAGGRRSEFAGVFEQLQQGTLSVWDIAPDELDIVLRCGVVQGGTDTLSFVMNSYYIPVLDSTGPGSPDSLSPFSAYQMLVSSTPHTALAPLIGRAARHWS